MGDGKVSIDYESQVRELQQRLAYEKDHADRHIAELTERLHGFERENEILKAKLSVVELIFGGKS